MSQVLAEVNVEEIRAAKTLAKAKTMLKVAQESQSERDRYFYASFADPFLVIHGMLKSTPGKNCTSKGTVKEPQLEKDWLAARAKAESYHDSLVKLCTSYDEDLEILLMAELSNTRQEFDDRYYKAIGEYARLIREAEDDRDDILRHAREAGLFEFEALDSELSNQPDYGKVGSEDTEVEDGRRILHAQVAVRMLDWRRDAGDTKWSYGVRFRQSDFERSRGNTLTG